MPNRTTAIDTEEKHVIVEFLTYRLREGSQGAFVRTMLEESLPLHREAGIRVVAAGASVEDDRGAYLIRAFDSLEWLEMQEERFYASEAWASGPRQAIVSHIEDSHRVVLPLTEAQVRALETSSVPDSEHLSFPVSMDWREDRIGSAARGENPTVFAELTSGYAAIGDVQFLPGYCVLLSKDANASALAELPRRERVQFLADVDLLAGAVERACREADPEFTRVNIEILGNADAFVHAHIWPRYSWEPRELLRRPVWLYGADKWQDPLNALSGRHAALRASIAEHLQELEDSGGVETA